LTVMHAKGTVAPMQLSVTPGCHALALLEVCSQSVDQQPATKQHR
jgi:hypothetical protein